MVNMVFFSTTYMVVNLANMGFNFICQLVVQTIVSASSPIYYTLFYTYVQFDQVTVY